MATIRCPFCHEDVDSAAYPAHEAQHLKLRPDGQQTEYATLPPEQRDEGSLAGVPQVYRHRKCGVATQMPEEIIRSYLKNPYMYLADATFCCGCGTHVPFRECVWVETGEDLQTYTDKMRAAKPEMKPKGCLGLLVVLAATFLGLAAWIALPPLTDASGPAPEGWKLTWSDEFDGKDIDRARWDFDIGNGFYNYDAAQWISGWGNDELQYYTREADNAFVKDGMLHIVARKESLHGCGYSSARLKTRKRDGSPLFSQKYGRFEFRAKLPTGKGVWPALWMLPQDEKHGGWAASGEIDVMEARGQEPTKVLGTLHFGGRWPVNTHVSKEYVLPKGGTIADFHVYALEWEPGEIRWSVDGHEYATQSFWWSSSKGDGGKGAKPAKEADLNPWPAPFDQPFYVVMNVAVGGKFLGRPDKTTAFPAEMVVDYVRVYEKVGGYGKPKPRGEGKLPFAK